MEYILNSLDNDSTSNSSYYPFPSAVYALLFMLVNSPRPIVSIKSIKISFNISYKETKVYDFHL